MKKWVILRRSSQALFCILFIYILWATTYPLTSSIPADTFFIIDPLIIICTSISERIILPGILFSFMLIGLTLIFGRFFCGWVCPLGTTFDMLGWLKKKKNKPSQKLRHGKYVFLGIITVSACTGIQIAWIGDPLVITARFVSLNLIPTVTLLINKIFIFIIQQFNLYGWFYDLYRSLKASLLGINPYYFSHSLITFLFFAAVCIPVFFIPRFWCRALCPLGALYDLCARYALFKRFVSSCTQCGQCTSICRMGAINPDASYEKQECILCMDCLYDCRPRVTTFGFSHKKTFLSKTGSTDTHSASHISRRNFLVILGISLFSQGFKKLNKKSSAGSIIRPPAALKEPAFLNRCVRCGNCMKVCVTNGLQPAFLESGLTGIWTPRLIPEIGYCEYNCTLCGQVCPTGAIPRLPVDKKRKVKLGIARIDRTLCLPWAEGKECIVCEEHCPIADKAIKIIEEDQKGNILLKPYMEESLCNGCGICQNKCPVLPIRAIRVNPLQADRTG